MTNDEFRMTEEFPMSNDEMMRAQSEFFRHSSFVIPSSLDIRHSSFFPAIGSRDKRQAGSPSYKSGKMPELR